MELELKNLIKSIKSAQIAEALVKELKLKKKEQQLRLIELTRIIEKENREINLLTNFSIRYIFRRLSGKINQNLELRNDFYLSISLQYNELIKSNNLIDYELDLLNYKVKKLPILTEQLKDYMIQKEGTLPSQHLNDYKIVIRKLEKLIKSANEIDEAIIEGVKVNKKFNKIINFLKNEENNIQISIYDNYKMKKLDRYQSQLVEIQIALLKFKKEYNDVHKELFGEINYSNSLIQNFIDQLRTNLITDFNGRSGLKHSLQILQNFKSNIMTLTKTLRSDVRKIDKEIVELEKEEFLLLENIISDGI